MAVRRSSVFLGLVALVSAISVLSGCPFSFESEPRRNAAPTTFFLGTPTDTTFLNTMQFNWNGTDEDSDVVAYQFQLVYLGNTDPNGEPIESIDPPNSTGAEQWSARTTDDFRAFIELDDGYYEMRVRAIDQQGTFDPDPARHKFYVFFDDISPEPVIIFPTQARLNGQTSIVFIFNATDQSRNAETPRTSLEYQYQLRANSLTLCSSHTNDVFTEWIHFPSGNGDITVGNQAPTIYSDLFSVECGWTFTLRVRDPAGNLGTVTQELFQNGS